jgi:hypothetical protein
MAGVCSKCSLTRKRPGSQFCEECWLAKQDAAVREQAADERLAMMPLQLRLARVPESDWPIGRRWCAGCQSFVRLIDCGKNASRCRTCAGRKQHAAMVERTYMIHGRPFTADDYAAMYAQQGGRCVICRRKSHTKRLAVDHDHETGEVRGLLCPGEWGCNFGILAKITDVAMARRILTYLEQNYAHTVIKS